MRSKKITKRLRKTQYKRKISRKTQKGGDMTAVLRKNKHYYIFLYCIFLKIPYGLYQNLF